MTKYKCKNCGGYNVQLRAWVKPNEGNKYVDDTLDETGYCEDCDDSCKIIPVEETSEETKTFRITWRHEVCIDAENQEEAEEKWRHLSLGNLEDEEERGNINSHECIILTTVEEV